jgi:hypothetical protein
MIFEPAKTFKKKLTKKFLFGVFCLALIILLARVAVAAKKDEPQTNIANVQSMYSQNKHIKGKYQFRNSQFIKTAKDKNSVKTEVGDPGSADFEPNLTISKWNGEASFKVKPDASGVARDNKKLSLDGEQINYKADKKDYIYYDDPTASENGGFEFKIILNEKPDTNTFSEAIESTGVEFYPQPPLNEETHNKLENIDHCTQTDCYDKSGKVVVHRPEDVVDSIAVYAAGKSGDYTAMGGMNYMAGKVAQIKRVKAIDATGNWAYCKQTISNGFWTKTCPQDFLDNAIYPVVIDPTFGYTGIGGSSTSAGVSAANTYAASRHTAVSGDTITKFSVYGSTSGSNSSAASYVWNGSVPTTRLAAGVTVVMPVSAGWADSGTVSQAMSNGVEYVIAVAFPLSVTFYYDAAGYTSSVDLSGPLLATWSEGLNNTCRQSSYATYSVAAPAPTITITNPNTSAAQSKTITATTTAGTLTMKVDAGSTCDETVADFIAYAPHTFTAEADNTKTVCYKAVGTGGTAYLLSSAIAGIDRTAPTIIINNPNISSASSKTIIATTTDGTLTMSNTTGLTCDGTLTFVAYSSQTFNYESDNGTKVCYKAADSANNIAYLMSNAIAGINSGMSIITLRPNAAGDETNFYRYSDAGYPYNWQCVADVTPDLFTSEIFGGDGGWITDTYNLPDPTSSGPISNVTLYNVDFTFPSGVHAKTICRLGAIDYPGSDTVISNDGNQHTYSTSYNNNPATSAPWTWSDINNLQIGVSGFGSGGNLSCTQVYAVVTYPTDATPPTVSGLADDATPTKSKTWTWSSEAGATFRYSIDQSSGGVPGGAYGATATATQSSGDGTYYIHVQAKDTAGNESGVTTVSAVLDNTAPVITIANPDSTPAQSKTVTATTTAGTLTMKVDAGSTCDGTVADFAAYAPHTFTSESDNGAKVCYRAADAAGNVSYLPSNAIAGIDATGPNITGLTTDTTPVKSKTWNWFSDVGTTFRFVIDTNASSTVSGIYDSTATAVQPSGNGTYYIHVQAKDGAGNESSVVTVSAVLDNTAPVITVSGTNPVSVTLGSTYADGGATATDNIDVCVNVVSSGRVDVATAGDYTITYDATDAAGNAAVPATRTVHVVAPDLPITKRAVNPISGQFVSLLTFA